MFAATGGGCRVVCDGPRRSRSGAAGPVAHDASPAACDSSPCDYFLLPPLGRRWTHLPSGPAPWIRSMHRSWLPPLHHRTYLRTHGGNTANDPQAQHLQRAAEHLQPRASLYGHHLPGAGRIGGTITPAGRGSDTPGDRHLRSSEGKRHYDRPGTSVARITNAVDVAGTDYPAAGSATADRHRRHHVRHLHRRRTPRGAAPAPQLQQWDGRRHELVGHSSPTTRRPRLQSAPVSSSLRLRPLSLPGRPRLGIRTVASAQLSTDPYSSNASRATPRRRVAGCDHATTA